MEVEPKLYRAIMVSSTFTDLEAHRREVIEAIQRFGFFPNVMEYSGARSDADVIDASLRMVRESVAYLCVIGHKYGQTPVDEDRNPKGLSITELEFNEARRLGRSILLFLMGDDHPVTKGDVEPDAKKQKKLDAFRKQAKRVNPDKPAERVYETFASKEEFAKKATVAIGLQAIQIAGGSDLPDRAIRDAIVRFIDVKPDANQTELTEAIERFEADYEALKQQLAAIAVTDNRVTSLKADAESALTEGDLDKARAAYREAAEAAKDRAAEPVRTAAELKAAEANAHLLALDWEAADAAWTEAEAMLALFEPKSEERLREEAGTRLKLHGELYARVGALAAAIDRWRRLVASADARGDQRQAALVRNSLGSTLRTFGLRTGGAEGLRLLDEARKAYADALTTFNRTDMPVEWATTQNNLGNALRALGERTDGSEGLRFLDAAVSAYRAALTVRTRADRPAEWATTKNNLGNALATQGHRAGIPQGRRLLKEAEMAYRDALSVRTRTGEPSAWGSTQNNLGNVLSTQGRGTGGRRGLRLLEQAVAAYLEALTVRTGAETPANWALTQLNMALTFESLATVDPNRAREYLIKAETAAVAALKVCTPEQMPFFHDKVTRSLARVVAALAALGS
jgi:tetratricopeptide (TPR) repeat protein